jgi:hypothetical protein
MFFGIFFIDTFLEQLIVDDVWFGKSYYFLLLLKILPRSSFLNAYNGPVAGEAQGDKEVLPYLSPFLYANKTRQKNHKKIIG